MSADQKTITELEGLTEDEKDRVVDFLYFTESSRAVWQPRNMADWAEICHEALRFTPSEARITELYNHHSALHKEAEKTMDYTELSYHSFVCNALASAVFRSNRKELREHFEKCADH